MFFPRRNINFNNNESQCPSPTYTHEWCKKRCENTFDLLWCKSKLLDIWYANKFLAFRPSCSNTFFISILDALKPPHIHLLLGFVVDNFSTKWSINSYDLTALTSSMTSFFNQKVIGTELFFLIWHLYLMQLTCWTSINWFLDETLSK